MKDAKQWLEIAIRRHERHMSGQEPTTGVDGEISQNLMMQEMKYSLQALNGESVTPIPWYTKNITNFPDKVSRMRM
jgi:hypothetical protein